ncbi:copper homeostasis protein CutC [Clostridium sp. ZS2-4]|uniref:copper homeostasis protein CutC n=1 Tax=Clostridium sp. ZS2-4 TaxID=2987703 RepID=UPI00227BB49C|nr:copper homeostasis protein CutC [Clostridium sp. ZS2-4]MCY6356124.1 copper homeostasis protein CutC [Clostridium sp. ZS2-4]
MKNNILIEVCVDSVESAIAAEKGGANRVELCTNLAEGGTTPSTGCIELVRRNIDIDLNVIVRPRGGDFCYSNFEFEVMKRDIRMAKKLGVNGVVIGILKEDGNIDIQRTKEIVELARPMSVTFHRAFDMTCDPFKALEEIIQLNIDRVLTSGHEKTAFEGEKLISRLVEKAEDNLIIMPGGGVNEENIEEIKNITGAREYHVSGRKKFESPMIHRNHKVVMGGAGLLEFERAIIDSERIKAIVNVGNS